MTSAMRFTVLCFTWKKSVATRNHQKSIWNIVYKTMIACNVFPKTPEYKCRKWVVMDARVSHSWAKRCESIFHHTTCAYVLLGHTCRLLGSATNQPPLLFISPPVGPSPFLTTYHPVLRSEKVVSVRSRQQSPSHIACSCCKMDTAGM